MGAPDPGPRAKARRRLAIAGGALLGVAIAFRVALPYAVERAVPITAERFGLDASVANVDFALLRGHVVIEGFRVAPLAAKQPGSDLLRLGRLFLNAEWGALFRGELRVAELAVEAPALHLVRAADGTLELPAMPPSSEPETEPEPAAPSEPMPVLVQSLSIRDTAFQLSDAVSGVELVDFRLKELGFSELRLAGAKIGLGGLRISEPVLRVRREVQATRAGGRAGPTPESAAAPEAAAPPAARDLRIDDLEIERAEFSVLTEGEPVSVALRLKTSGVSLAPESPFPFEFGLEAGEGSLELSGRLGLDPLVWDGHVRWQGLPLRMLVRAALPELTPWLRSCRASGDLDVKLRLGVGGGPAPGLRASGRIGVDDFLVEDPEQELALGWKSLVLELGEASVPLDGGAEPIQVAVAKVALLEPSARYVLPNTAVERLGKSVAGEERAEEAPAPGEPARAPTGSEPAAEPESVAPGAARETAARPEPRIRIDTIEVRGGSAEFRDRSRTEPYQGRVRDLSVDVSGVRLPERTLDRLRVRGIAPDRAPFDLQGQLPGASGTLALKLERLPLAQFTPYAASAAALRIAKGDLTLDAKGRLAKAGASGELESRIVVHQLSIEAGPNALKVAGLPLDLALALLRDPRGDIRLPIPVRYGEQGASAGVGTIVRGALQAALTGAVTSPLKAVGALLPSGAATEVSFEPIAFLPGSAEPGPDADARVGPLLALLQDRPGLGLALVGRAGSEDRPKLAEQILIERVSAGRDLPPLEDAGFFARRRIRSALEARGRGEAEAGALEAEDQALFARYLAATEVPAERSRALARQRAEALAERIARGLAQGRGRLAVEAAVEPGRPEVDLELRVSPLPEASPPGTAAPGEPGKAPPGGPGIAAPEPQQP